MNLSEEKIYNFSAVEPSYMYRYLQDNGWREESKIDDRASILTLTLENRKFSTLLPLKKDIPDFESRMYDVFKVLEVAEKRPRSEILKGLVDSGAIAIKKDREVLSLRFKFIDSTNQYQFSARKLGMILTSLQDLCDAVGRAEIGNDSILKKFKKEITDKTELSVFETFKGSFGVKLALAPNVNIEQLRFLESSLAERVASKFLELIRQSDNV
ncbi:MAG: hypothetical protein SVX43_16285, partial [Cyanobacteriota bacterium]|nr:hypothetical protein [Cyanobacteriota bacterium]